MNEEFDNKIHIIGRVTVLAGFMVSFLYPLALIFIFKVPPLTVAEMVAGVFSILILMVPASIGEFLSIAPMIGPSAMYLMVLTGNYMSIKIPASMCAMEAAGLDTNVYTEESDIISTIAMAISTIVSEVIIIIGVLLLVPLTSTLGSPTLKPAFDNIVPALFGAIGFNAIRKNVKVSIAPIALGFIILYTKIIPQGISMVFLVGISLIAARIEFKAGWFKPKANKDKEIKA